MSFLNCECFDCEQIHILGSEKWACPPVLYRDNSAVIPQANCARGWEIINILYNDYSFEDFKYNSLAKLGKIKKNKLLFFYKSNWDSLLASSQMAPNDFFCMLCNFWKWLPNACFANAFFTVQRAKLNIYHFCTYMYHWPGSNSYKSGSEVIQTKGLKHWRRPRPLVIWMICKWGISIKERTYSVFQLWYLILGTSEEAHNNKRQSHTSFLET